MTDKTNLNKENPQRSGFTKRVLAAVGITASIVLLIWFITYTVHVLLIVFAGVLLAIFLLGLSNWLSKLTNLSQGWSLAVVMIFLITLIGLILALLAPRTADQVNRFSEGISQSIQEVQRYIDLIGWKYPILDQMPKPKEFLSGQTNILTRATGVLSSTLGILTNIIIILFIGIYVAVNPDLYRRGITRLVPIAKRGRTHEVLNQAGISLRSWLIGRAISMTAVGVLTTLGLFIIGVPLAFTLGLLAGTLAFVPYFGPIISVVPAVLLGLLQSPTVALYVIILYVAIQTIESYLLTPIVQKEMVDLPPALTITAQVILGILLGVPGIVFATPLTVLLLILFKMLYVEDTLGDRVDIEN